MKFWSRDLSCSENGVIGDLSCQASGAAASPLEYIFSWCHVKWIECECELGCPVYPLPLSDSALLLIHCHRVPHYSLPSNTSHVCTGVCQLRSWLHERSICWNIQPILREMKDVANIAVALDEVEDAIHYLMKGRPLNFKDWRWRRKRWKFEGR